MVGDANDRGDGIPRRSSYALVVLRAFCIFALGVGIVPGRPGAGAKSVDAKDAKGKERYAKENRSQIFV
jgi:hypothetical protein